MPQMGISEDSAVLTKWYIKKGDAVKVGDILFSIETGKTSFDIESEYEGTILELLVTEFQEVLVQSAVCIIGKPGENYVIPQQSQPLQPSQPHIQVASGASQRAKMLAKKAGVDFTHAVPTGPEGRIIERDIRALMESDTRPSAIRPETHTFTETAVEYFDKPLTAMRKAIAKNMMDSLAQTAQLTHTASFDATSICAYREILKKSGSGAGITLNDMVLYAATRTLRDFPDLNAWLMDGTMRYFKEVNLARYALRHIEPYRSA
jgi:pyruvate dehydrogenase E2 component (dihydrolipoamide acetyltransferase)